MRLTDPFTDLDAVHVANLAPRRPVELNVTRWRCPTCRKSWSKKPLTQKHIDFGCVHDPEVRACMTCKHFDEGHSFPGCDKGLTITSPIPRRCSMWERSTLGQMPGD